MFVSKQGKSRKSKQIINRAARTAVEGLEPRVLLASTPFSGTPFQLPTTIQAEDFDKGGQGVAYYDETKPNQGGQYRLTESVDIENTTDVGGGYDVTYVLPTEWMLYTVNSPTAASYNVSFRVASPQAGGTFHLDVDGKVATGEITVPNTGGTQNWTTITAPSSIAMTAGQHVVGIYFDSAPSASDPYTMNFNWMQFNAAPPSVSIAATDPNAAEATRDPGVFTVTRSGSTASAITVPVTFSGSAVNGTDYNALSSSVTIPAGQTSTTITVTPLDRGIVGGSKSVLATLGSGTGFTVGSPNSATVTIVDNDVASSLPTVTIAATDPSAAEANADPGVFTITRTGATTAALTVPFTFSGTAANGTDYQSITASATIAAGQSSATVTITPINRGIVGGTKSVVATLGSSAAYSIGSANSATVTIADNDVASPPPGEAPFGGTAWAIPGVIQAENFDTGGEGVAYHDTDTANDGAAYRTSEGVDIEATTDAGGGYDVGWTHAGEWIKYTVNLATAGTYNFDARLADTSAGGTFHVTFNGVNATGELGVPNSGGWQTFTDVTKSGISLAAGTYVMEIFFDSNDANGFDGNFNYFKLTAAAPALPTVSVAATTPSAAESGSVPGLFTITRSGSTASALPVNYVLSGTAVNGTDYQSLPGTVTIAAGQSSATVTVTPIDEGLTSGSKTVVLTASSNAAYTVGTPSGTVTIAENDTPKSPTEAPFGGTPWAIPGTIQAENFDTGGEGIAYHDTDASNLGASYRTTEGVDIEPTSDSGGGYDVGWTHAGEWLNYTVNVATTGTYTLDERVADTSAGGTFHITFNGVNATGEVATPNTGGWQTFTDAVQNNISLAAGTYVMQIHFDSNDANGFAGNFNWFSLTAASTALPTVSVAATSPNAGESGPTPGVFTVSRSGSTSSPLTVNYTLSGTAVNGTDYQSLPGFVTIAAGQSSATVTVTPIDEGLTSGSKTVVLTASANSAYTLGTAAGTVTIAENDGTTGSQPDLQIRNYGDTTYTGVGIINANASGQVKGNDQPFLPSIFQLQVVNTGSVPDSFNITGLGSTSPDWRVWYYDSQVQGRSGGNDISAQVTSGGWNTGVLAPGQVKDFRVEVGAEPTASYTSQYAVTVTATSTNDPKKSDTVEAIGQIDKRYEVEIERKNFAQVSGESGTYLLNLENYGNISDQYRVTATGNGSGYTVKYFDAYSGGDDITTQVTSTAGWLTSPIGFHALQGMAVQITSLDGKVHSITLTVVSAGNGGVRQSITISNAAPVASPSFFPIGVWDQPTQFFSEWQARGINTLVQYDSFGGQTSIAQWSQLAQQDGLYMIRQASPNPADDLQYSNLLAWMQPDEEELPSNNYSAAAAAQVYAQLKAVNPNMPVFANFDGSEVVGWQTDVPLSAYNSYVQSADWDSTGVYPISGWDRPDDLDVSGRALDRIQNISQGAPQFAIIESSDQLGSWLPPGSPAPQATQVRAEIWDSIVHGAQGIIYFPQSFTPGFKYDNTPADVASEITTQNALITSIGPALESPIDPPSLGVTASAPLEATWRSYNGHEYYIVFNYSNNTTTQTFNLQGTGAATSATVQGEGRTVSLSNGTVSDTFAPYSVHVYVV